MNIKGHIEENCYTAATEKRQELRQITLIRNILAEHNKINPAHPTTAQIPPHTQNPTPQPIHNTLTTPQSPQNTQNPPPQPTHNIFTTLQQTRQTLPNTPFQAHHYIAHQSPYYSLPQPTLPLHNTQYMSPNIVPLPYALQAPRSETNNQASPHGLPYGNLATAASRPHNSVC